MNAPVYLLDLKYWFPVLRPCAVSPVLCHRHQVDVRFVDQDFTNLIYATVWFFLSPPIFSNLASISGSLLTPHHRDLYQYSQFCLRHTLQPVVPNAVTVLCAKINVIEVSRLRLYKKLFRATAGYALVKCRCDARWCR